MIALSARLPRMLAFGAASLVVCAGQASAESLDDLYAKAKLEKTVVLYGAGPTGSHERWIRDFQQRFPGITVSLTGGLSPALSKKIEQQLADQADGNRPCHPPDHPGFRALEDSRARCCCSSRKAPTRSIPPSRTRTARSPRSASTPSSMPTTPSSSRPADVPKSALDFLKARFEGQLITTDPAEDDAALAIFNLIVDKYGWDYMDKYLGAEAGLRHHRPRRRVERDCRRREARDLRFRPRPRGGSSATASRSSRCSPQADDTPIFLVGAAIFKDAPHPNAAKLYLTWYLATEQQSRSGAFSPRSDVPPPEACSRCRPTRSTAAIAGW